MSEKKKHVLGAWMQELQKAADGRKVVEFETTDGVRRSGRLTGLRKTNMRLNGRDQPLITQFELNDDATDVVQFFNLKSLNIHDD
jgi:translation initiation factor IF-1